MVIAEVEILQVDQIADIHMNLLNLVVLQLKGGQFVQGFDALRNLFDRVAFQAELLEIEQLP